MIFAKKDVFLFFVKLNIFYVYKQLIFNVLNLTIYLNLSFNFKKTTEYYMYKYFILCVLSLIFQEVACSQETGISISFSISHENIKSKAQVDSIKTILFERIEKKYKDNLNGYNIPTTKLYNDDSKDCFIFIEIKDTITETFEYCLLSKFTMYEKDIKHNRFSSETLYGKNYGLLNVVSNVINEITTLLTVMGNISLKINTFTQNKDVSELRKDDKLVKIENIFIQITKGKGVEKSVYDIFNSIITNSLNYHQIALLKNFGKSETIHYCNLHYEKPKKNIKMYSITYSIHRQNNDYVLKMAFHGIGKIKGYSKEVKFAEEYFKKYPFSCIAQINECYLIMKKIHKMD